MSRPKSDFVERILSELRKNRGALTAEQAAKLAKRNESYLRHTFTAVTGTNFRRARLHARLEPGRRLLINSTLSIPKISDRLGYSHRSKFEKAFKTVFGLTPTQYRRRNNAISAKLD